MLSTRVSLPAELQAPIRKGTILGTVSVYKGEEIIAESPLIAMGSAERKVFADYLSQVIEKWVHIIN